MARFSWVFRSLATSSASFSRRSRVSWRAATKALRSASPASRARAGGVPVVRAWRRSKLEVTAVRPTASSTPAQQKMGDPRRQARLLCRASGKDRPRGGGSRRHAHPFLHRAPPAELELGHEARPAAAGTWDYRGCLPAGPEADLSFMTAAPQPPGAHRDRYGARASRRRFPGRLAGGHLRERPGGLPRTVGPTSGRGNPWRPSCCPLPTQASLAPTASLHVGGARGDVVDRAAEDGYRETLGERERSHSHKVTTLPTCAFAVTSRLPGRESTPSYRGVTTSHHRA
jgi:hypothetical protein